MKKPTFPLVVRDGSVAVRIYAAPGTTAPAIPQINEICACQLESAAAPALKGEKSAALQG